MTRVVSILVVICSIGCAKHSTPDPFTLHPSVWWESSNSPCTDALQINLIAEGCKEIGVQNIENVWWQFRCQQDGEGSWSAGWWLFTPTGIEPMPGHAPVCIDEMGMLSIREQ